MIDSNDNFNLIVLIVYSLNSLFYIGKVGLSYLPNERKNNGKIFENKRSG